MLEELCETLGRAVVVEDAKTLGIYLSYTFAWGPPVRSLKKDALKPLIDQLTAELEKRFTLENLKNDPVVRAYRDFYWRLNIDPTKVRPANEALVRRALKRSFPSINPVVDAGNIASAETLIPIGMYDVNKIVFPCRARLSNGGELFKPIGGSPEVLLRGVPILSDSAGKVLHIFPHRDSVETMVTEDTTSVLIVAAGVRGVDPKLVERAAARTGEILEVVGWNWCRSVVTEGLEP